MAGQKQDPEETPDFLQRLASMAVEAGMVVLERFDCECGETSLLGHVFEESMQCPHCKKSMASDSPRPAMPGEVNLDHLTGALAFLKESYENAAKDMIPPTGELPQYATLDDRTRLVINQTATRLVVSAFTQLEKLAILMANGGRPNE